MKFTGWNQKMPYADPEKRREAIRRSKQRPAYKANRRKKWAERYVPHPLPRKTEEEKKQQKAETGLQYRKEHAAEIKVKNAKRFQRDKGRIQKHYLVRRFNSPQLCMADRLRGLLRQALKKNYRASKATDYIGCTLAEFRSYIASLFQTGMSWSNHGEWHLDHVVPLCKFDLTDADEAREAMHYTNFQPLWAEDNFKKNRFTVT